MISRHVQKLSRPAGLRASESPAIAALECMAVQVCLRRQQDDQQRKHSDAARFPATTERNAAHAVDLDQNIVLPAIQRERLSARKQIS